ncbi:MAG TPA: ATP-binding protein [Vicinamibacterales bacterium]|nr:ATP-binding protein [Vicinamibacterales bacterium]
MLSSGVRLRTRLVALGLIATAPALVVLLYTQSIERTRAREQTVADIRQVTQLAAGQQATWFDGVQRLLLTLAQLPDVQSSDASACRRLLPGVLRDHPGYINIWIDKTSSPNNAFCEAIPVDPKITAAHPTRPWYRRAVESRTTAVGDFQVSPVTNMPDVIIAHPLLSPAGAIEGVVAAAISLQPLNSIAARAQLPPGTTLTLMDRQRKILAEYPGGRRRIGDEMPVLADSALFAMAHVKSGYDTGLDICMEVEPRAAMASTNALLQRQAVLLLLLLAATIAASLIGGERFVRRPIAALADVTRRLATGDLSARAHLRRSAPGVDDLAIAVNAMATEMEIRSRAERRAQSELRESEERLRHAQKLETVGQLAAGVAHNFNNLLTVIAGFTELMMARHAEGLDRADLEEIRKAAGRGAVLTRQLLAFSRRQDAAPTRLDLNQTISELRDMLGRVIREDIALNITLAPTPAWVLVDPHEVEQVVLNLVLNARDAMPAGGLIDIRISHTMLDAATAAPEFPALTGWYVCISVRDTGTGMPPDVRRHLFEPFFTTKDAGKGTGMGLASIDAIVRQNRGGIAVDTAPGAGSTFSIYLPAVSAELQVPAPETAQRLGAVPGEGATILLVEDEDPLRAVVARMLGQAGYRVLDARDAREARQLFAQHKDDISVLVTDVIMPEMNGPALAQRLVAERPELRVLFVSGYSEELPVLNAPGKSQFLPKPFSSATLVAAVADLLERRS